MTSTNVKMRFRGTLDNMYVTTYHYARKTTYTTWVLIDYFIVAGNV